METLRIDDPRVPPEATGLLDAPDAFEASRGRLAAEDAVVLDGYRGVWRHRMLRRYDRLAARRVELGERTRSRAELEALLRERTRPAHA